MNDPRMRLVRELKRVSADGLVTYRFVQRDPEASADRGNEGSCGGVSAPPPAGSPHEGTPARSGAGVPVTPATAMLLRLVAIHDDRTPADWIAQAVSARAEAIGIGRLADEIERHGGDLAGCDVGRHADSERANPARRKR